ncbi:hypothetical protein [Legionella israelensis]|uniref:Uncharacterized protein n=1 Tax=Legionella israelensis TaxID=454 RepID=A0A0W0VYR7_9GAMM|nr:hypothetical protein [Legionella israelensis]KTD25054.1 hypothetical protein Lisr_1279 [Legionella israelensis]QBS10620.1 type II secretion system protein [Legionella israelensis]SCY18830.1 hypothetical protein SAMN02746069_01571 [Legionella israelensis DSM 19235]STX57570.1 Uncharacterised protein [Legionella israelensis]
MKNQDKGFVLFTTLTVITIMALLLLTRMHELLLFSKMSARQKLQHQDFYQLEYVARKLVKMDFTQIPKPCRCEMDKMNNVFALLKKKGKGCSLFEDTRQYYYFIEDLGEKNCLMIRYQGQKRSTHHFRYTVVYLKEHQFYSALQLRFIKPGQFASCQGKEKTVKEGISSWRYLTQVFLESLQKYNLGKNLLSLS